ncbi:hypothetical protein H5410_024398 [Solanum commersonii]|uniref:EF-hand domain-containing protein n=1 Tax=Solanum commersonii TaxID=4109 RepID=A0A9J5ZLU5_SOLCO|nr:hypothetical protein H5410_024398 [Solanum commersonii]
MLNFIRPSRNNIKCVCSHVHLSDEQLTKVIKKYDSNGDNYLNKEDLKELFRQLGSKAPRWRAARAIHHADKNGDGRIDMTTELDQLVKYARKHGCTLASACCKKNIIRCTCGHVPLTEVQLTNLFKKCDFNGDGYLTKEDLTEAFRQLGSTFPGYRAGRALHRADKNGDGLIDKKELDKLVDIEYRSVSSDGKCEMTLAEFKRWLKKFDENKDGKISKEDLREAVRSNGGWFRRIKVHRAVKSADANGDGSIDEDEIMNLAEFALKHLGIRIVSY